MEVYPSRQRTDQLQRRIPSHTRRNTLDLGLVLSREEQHANSTGATYVPPTLRALFLAVKYLINTFLPFFAGAIKPAVFLFFHPV